MEDCGGVSLKDYAKTRTIALDDFLAIAIQLADILNGLYQKQVIHKDLKPANILIHPETKAIKLIDFSISSLLPHETQSVQTHKGLEGTLTYLSPEQTGRMNRGVDYRSDFYSLGVTLYELLTGQLPFLTKDPMELVHCHVAKQPTPPHLVVKSEKGVWEDEGGDQGDEGERESGRVSGSITPPSLHPFTPPPLHPSLLLIPEALSNIVMKLMAKNAEDRYQSALGLKHDLEHCLQQLQTTGHIPSFDLGQRDICDRFLIPEKLYGRQQEVSVLLAAFERVSEHRRAGEGESARGGEYNTHPPILPSSHHPPITSAPLPLPPHSELILVAGYSGIGKTAVINEVHKPIVRQRGYFIKGKFDQFQNDIPFSALLQVFRDLIGQLLRETDEQLNQWKHKILSALGDNGQVIIQVIPELEQVIGQQPPVDELSGDAAQNRFNLLFQQFIQVFTAPDHPLVMFLDDLQWADLASLKLLRMLLHKTAGYLLIIGAYRDNEVSPVHPLMLAIEEARKTGARISTLTLAPLTQTDLNQLIADTLNCPAQLAEPLTDLVYQKTQGNPFFTTQFLKTLHTEGWITFNRELGYWQCDIIQVRSLTLSDDVVEFMALQLQKLPDATQQVLQLAACIGNQFDLATLSIVYEKSHAETAADLWSALQEGLVVPINEVYKFFQGDLETRDSPSETQHEQEVSNRRATFAEVKMPDSGFCSYRFLHDRIQQAAYFLIPDDQQQITHFKIGKRLLANYFATEREAHLFEIVSHLNASSALITQPTEYVELAQLNLMAGQKAKAATAYATAVGYFSIGINVLPEDAWTTYYYLTLALHTERLEAAYLNASFDRLNPWGDRILEQAKTLLDVVKVYEIRLIAARAQGNYEVALQTGLQVLQSLGINFPEQPTASDIEQAFANTRQLWEGRHPLHLLNLPIMCDPHRLAAMQIMTNMISSAYMAAPVLMPLLICKQVDLSIQYGNCPTSVFSYADYGLLLCGIIGDLDAGYDFGQLALVVLERFQAKPCKSRAEFIVQNFIRHWKNPLRELLPHLLEGYQSGLVTGDLESLSLNAQAYCYYSYFAGKELTGLAEESESYYQALYPLKQEPSLRYLEIVRQTILNLLGQTELPAHLTGTVYNAEYWLPLHQANCDRTALFHFYFNQTVLYYLFGQYTQASQASEQVEQYFDGGLAQVPVTLYPFYDALIHLALYKQSSVDQQQQILDRVQRHQEKLQHWATLAPFNHQHRWELVEAERRAVLGDRTAIDCYDRAIAGAKDNGYVQDEALANELAAKFYLDWGKDRIAQDYLHKAYYGYAYWGAAAKVKDLEQTYPVLLASILQQGRLQRTSTLTQSNSTLHSIVSKSNYLLSLTANNDETSAALDLATVLKASQTLSGEIKLEQLLSTLLQVVMENAGAEKCVLLLLKQDQFWVEAISTVDQCSIVSQSVPLEESQDVPMTLINSVKRTLQPAVITDASVYPALVADAYISRQQPKSLLCMPIINQGKLLGILYLENNLIAGAFTGDRVEILNLLCTQAAISLENARLYQQSQSYAQQLEQSLEKLRISEARFQKLADNVPGTIYQLHVSAQGRTSMLYISSGCYNVYEVTAEDIMAGTYSPRSMEHPEDVAGIDQAMAEAVHTQTPFVHEWRIITPSGNVKWVQGISRPEWQADGAIVWDGILIDISERKRIEAEQKRLLAILENTLDFIGTADPTGKTLYLNRAWRNLLNLDHEEAVKQLNISQCHPDWALEMILNQALPEAMRSGTWIGETAILDSAGREIPVSQMVLAHKSSDGAVEYFSTVLRDISQIKTAEAALKVSEKNLRALFDHSNNAIFVHNIDGTLLDVNNRMLDMYHLNSREEALALAALDYSAPDNPFEQVPLLWSRALAGETVCFEWKSQRPGDRFVFDTEIVLNKITLDDNEVILASIQDISERQAALRERKRAEEAVLQKSQELSQALKDLQNTQLQMVQSEKMASLGNLVAGVAHEINNPIGFLNGSINNVKDYVKDLLAHLALYQHHHPNAAAPVQDHAENIDLEFLSKDLPKLLDSMKGATDRIKSISISLRTFSRADAEHKVSANLHKGIDSTLLILKYRIKANEHRPTIEIIQNYGNLPEIQCFPGQLNQVFMNILANAIDVFDEAAQHASFAELEVNPQKITIQTTAIQQTAVEIRISDNGTGMSEDVKTRIFDHLFTTKGVGKGTGLGLAIARQIVVEKHQGSIEVQSTLGQGTTFTITLPIR
jgi:PAS domain S-box-containing protein